MAQRTKADISSILKYFQPIDKSCPEYGETYKVTLPDEIIRNSSYSHETQPAPQPSYVPLPTTDQTSGFGANSQYRYQKRLGLVQSFSPYEFRTSIDIPFYWKKLAQFDRIDIQNINFEATPTIEDIKCSGTTYYYNSEYNGFKEGVQYDLPLYNASISSRSPKPLEEDPEILKILSEETEHSLRVVSTSKCLAAIGVCARTLFPYDLHFSKKDDKTVFVSFRSNDTYQLKDTFLETLYLPEAVSRAQPTADFFENMAEVQAVFSEVSSLLIDRANPVHFEEFIIKPIIPEAPETPEVPQKRRRSKRNKEIQEEQVLPPLQPEPEPERIEQRIISGKDENDPKIAYVYRRIVLDDIEFIVRGEIECINKKFGSKPELCMIRSFSDIPTPLRRVQWTKDLINSPTGVFSHETSINGSNVGRWAAEAVLNGVSRIFVGYALRKVQNSSKGHILLGVQKFIPLNLNRLIALSSRNMYGIIHNVFAPLIDEEPGEFEFVKNPAKISYYLYREEPEPIQTI